MLYPSLWYAIGLQEPVMIVVIPRLAKDFSCADKLHMYRHMPQHLSPCWANNSALKGDLKWLVGQNDRHPRASHGIASMQPHEGHLVHRAVRDNAITHPHRG